MIPEHSRETATYGGRILAFELPSDYGYLTVRSSHWQSGLYDSALPTHFKALLGGFFQKCVVTDMELQGSVLYLRLATVSPCRDHLTTHSALDLFRQAFAYLARIEIPEQQWSMLPTVVYRRGEGFSLGAAGEAMAQVMDGICSRSDS